MPEDSPLRALRKTYQLTLEEFATEAGITRVTQLQAELGWPIPQPEARKIQTVVTRLGSAPVPIMVKLDDVSEWPTISLRAFSKHSALIPGKENGDEQRVT